MFDEPVNGLDPDGVRWVRQLTRSLAAEGHTVFVSSHRMSEIQLTADQIVASGTDVPAMGARPASEATHQRVTTGGRGVSWGRATWDRGLVRLADPA